MVSNKSYDTFDIMDKAGIVYQRGGDQIRFKCPFCGKENSRSKNMSVKYGGHNHGYFQCFGCGVKGGAMQLYVALTNSSLNPSNEADKTELNKEILSFLGIAHEGEKTHYHPVNPVRKEIPESRAEQPPIDIAVRNDVYTALLEDCPLSKKHRAMMKNRGFSDSSIEANCYRSMPRNADLIVQKLIKQGHVLKGVPGFYEENNKWKFAWYPEGVLIPIRNKNRLIEGLNIRVDDPLDGNKYLHITSWNKPTNCPNGAKAVSTIHVRGERFDEIILTEGAFKADLTFQQLNVPVIAMMGVGIIQPVILFLKTEEVKMVRIGIDMDVCNNQFVYKNLTTLMDTLETLGIPHSMLTWDSAFKGIDDYLVAGMQ